VKYISNLLASSQPVSSSFACEKVRHYDVDSDSRNGSTESLEVEREKVYHSLYKTRKVDKAVYGV